MQQQKNKDRKEKRGTDPDTDLDPRISTSDYRIRIREAQKHTYPTDPGPVADPEH
jgi:hypothetical protein